MYAFTEINTFPFIEGHKLKQIHNAFTKECGIIWDGNVYNNKYQFILSDDDGAKLIEQLEKLKIQHSIEIRTTNDKFAKQLEDIMINYKKIT